MEVKRKAYEFIKNLDHGYICDFCNTRYVSKCAAHNNPVCHICGTSHYIRYLHNYMCPFCWKIMASIELIGRHVCDPNHPGHYLHKRITIPSAIAIHRIVDDYMVIEIDQDGKKLSELVKRMRGKGNFRFWFKTLKRKFRTDKVTIKMVAEPMGMSEEEAYKIINEISKGAKGFYINIKDDGCLHYWE